MDDIHLKRKRIEGHAPGPHLLITGGVHGDEFEPMAAIRRLIGSIRPDELRGTLTLVPVVNEPAYLRGHRTAEDEIDLARTCPGKPDGTITERVAHAVSQLIREADYYIDLHTGGTTLSVLPFVGYKLVPDEEVLDRQREMAKAFNLSIVWGTDYRLEGRTLSVARDAKVPTIYAEYLGAATCDSEGVQAYFEGCLNVMAVLEMIDRQLPESRVEHVVEDPRENAGHMQICNPAPMTGFFEPVVQLGQMVEVGHVLGTVCDILGERVETVTTAQAGIVLVLKTFSRVLEGDGLAVILELV